MAQPEPMICDIQKANEAMSSKLAKAFTVVGLLVVKSTLFDLMVLNVHISTRIMFSIYNRTGQKHNIIYKIRFSCDNNNIYTFYSDAVL